MATDMEGNSNKSQTIQISEFWKVITQAPNETSVWLN